ncbi:MAG: hypothetical protein LH472_06035 [Pyrinomonadaceae bacterium]|nr:hypothetical protein [Pyrinomonadaceae bacterium]
MDTSPINYQTTGEMANSNRVKMILMFPLIEGCVGSFQESDFNRKSCTG